MKRLAFAVLFATLAAGCGSDSTGPSSSATGDFDITISSGTKPTYSWPGGTAFSISVVRVSSPGSIVWGVANTSMIIPSPVTHGTVPSAQGTVASSTLETTLTAGVAYRIAITRNDQKTGYKEFTP
jgi:hypothetical protein